MSVLILLRYTGSQDTGAKGQVGGVEGGAGMGEGPGKARVCVFILPHLHQLIRLGRREN